MPPSDNDFTRRRARQLMNGGAPVAVNHPLAGAVAPRQVYGVTRGPNNSVVFQFGDVRFMLERDDAIRMSLLTLKCAGCEVDLGHQEPTVQDNVGGAGDEPDADPVLKKK